MFFAAVRNRLARVLLAALLIAAVVMPPWAPLLRPAHAAVLPELPRVYLNTTYTLPTGPTITVPAGGDFQGALNSAQPNSVIILTAASTWASTSSAAYAVVNLDGSPAPANLVFDRCYIHGTPTGSLRNGVIINSASTAILDSWISDVHELSNEAHGILGNSGPGPFKL